MCMRRVRMTGRCGGGGGGCLRGRGAGRSCVAVGRVEGVCACARSCVGVAEGAQYRAHILE